MVCWLLKLESGRQFAVERMSHPNLSKEEIKYFPSALCTEAMSSFRESQLPNGFFPRFDTMQLPIPPHLFPITSSLGHHFCQESPWGFVFNITQDFNQLFSWLVMACKVRPWEPVCGSLSERAFRITRFHHSGHIELRTHCYLSTFQEKTEGHPSTKQSSRRQHQSFSSLPPILLIQGLGLKSLEPLAAAIRLERPRGQNHSQCAQQLRKMPTIDPVEQSKECRAVRFTSREVQEWFAQEAQSVNSPQSVTMPRRTGWRSTTLPSKSLSPEKPSLTTAI